jgi:hypothetical protein
MTEVSGQVTINGKPVAARLIMNLVPVNPEEGREDETPVQNGEYRHTVIAGRYKVGFTQSEGAPVVPVKYRLPNSSGLVLDATRSEPTNFDLK